MQASGPVPPRRSVCALACVLAACGAEPGTADTAAGAPTPYTPDLADAAVAVPLTTGELEEGLAEVLAYLLRQDPLLQHDAWTQVFDANVEDGVCPVVGDHNGQDYWRQDCTTAAGAHFNGWMLNFRGGGWREGDLNVRQYNWLSGHAFIEPPDGTRLENYGDVELLFAEGAYGLTSGFVYGDFQWDDPAGAGTWLQEPVSGELYFEFQDHFSYQSVWYDGGLTAFSGPVLAARLEDVAIDDAPGSCPVEPAGTVRLRDRDGGWYDVAFGASGDADVACDGCGEATRDGTLLGAVCADWSPFVSWQGTPWGS